MTTLLPQIEEPLVRLAPVKLSNYRVKRYRGDTLCLPISVFSERDRDRVRRLYAILLGFLTNLSHVDAASRTAGLEEFLGKRREEELATLAQDFGQQSMARNPSEELAEAVHDLRGGGLTPLVGLLQLAALRPGRDGLIGSLYYLTRDHLKIMRNILLGLDDVRRANDLQTKPHTTDLIVEKWHESVLHEDGRQARVVVDCRRVTTIGECCVEFGALDRIFYNLVNNACRHTADEQVRIIMFPVPDADGENLRFVFLNRISRADQARLAHQDLGALFQPRTSTTGSGYGLAIVREFVRHAFGLAKCEDAVRNGYVGASLIEDSFAAWFHWPQVGER